MRAVEASAGVVAVDSGVGVKVAQVIVAETGADMSRVPSAAHLASWAGLAPAVFKSAGKHRSAGTRNGNKWLTAMLVEATGSMGRMKGANYLSAQNARLPACVGWPARRSRSPTRSWSQAIGCSNGTSRTATSARTGTPSVTPEAHTRRLVAQLEKLGHTVALDAPAA